MVAALKDLSPTLPNKTLINCELMQLVLHPLVIATLYEQQHWYVSPVLLVPAILPQPLVYVLASPDFD